MTRDLFPFIAEDGLMGYKDLDGNIRIPAQWDIAKHFGYTAGFLSDIPGKETGVARVRKGGKWGIIDENGDYTVPCEYDEIKVRKYWPNDRVLFELIDRCDSRLFKLGLADETGKLMLSPSYRNIKGVYDELILIKDATCEYKEYLDSPDWRSHMYDGPEYETEHLFNYVTRQDVPQRPFPKWNENALTFFFNKNLVPYILDNQFGIMDSRGNEVLKRGMLPGGLKKAYLRGAYVVFESMEGKCFLLETKSHAINLCSDDWQEIKDAPRFGVLTANGWWPFHKEDGHCWLRNINGTELPYDWRSAQANVSDKAFKAIVQNGWFPLIQDGKGGIMNQNGEVVLAAKYDIIDVVGECKGGFGRGFFDDILKCVANGETECFAISDGTLYKFPTNDFKFSGGMWHLFYGDGGYFAYCKTTHDNMSYGWMFFPYKKYCRIDALHNPIACFACTLTDLSRVDILNRKGELICSFSFDPEAGSFFNLIGGSIIAQKSLEYGENYNKYFTLEGLEITKTDLPAHCTVVKGDQGRGTSGCLVDLAGNVLTESFTHISEFFYNRAYVEQKSRSGVIDTEGNFIVPLTSKLKKITTFRSGYAECQIKTKEGYVDGIIDLWGGIKANSGEGGLIKI